MDARKKTSLEDISDQEQKIPCIALPEPNLSLEQDTEWCVIQDGSEWRQIRFHDYGDVYVIPGLYERLFYDILKCCSPTIIRKLLQDQLAKADEDPRDLRVLDVGAGNGMVGEELLDMGAGLLVGTDILQEAMLAAERDRSDVYDDYLVADLTDLGPHQRRRLETHKFNALTCVAALGFGDIPAAAFAVAYNLIADDGWIAFNIKEDFLTERDSSGFCALIRRMSDEGLLRVSVQKRYQHRMATTGEPLFYVAIVGRKRENIPANWID